MGGARRAAGDDPYAWLLKLASGSANPVPGENFLGVFLKHSHFLDDVFQDNRLQMMDKIMLLQMRDINI